MYFQVQKEIMKAFLYAEKVPKPNILSMFEDVYKVRMNSCFCNVNLVNSQINRF